MFSNIPDNLGEKINSKILSRKRRLLREKFGVANNVPVIFDDNVQEPTIEGSRGGWYTKAGIPIRFPNAYAKKGRSNMVYKRSTLLIKSRN